MKSWKANWILNLIRGKSLRKHSDKIHDWWSLSMRSNLRPNAFSVRLYCSWWSSRKKFVNRYFILPCETGCFKTKGLFMTCCDLSNSFNKLDFFIFVRLPSFICVWKMLPCYCKISEKYQRKLSFFSSWRCNSNSLTRRRRRPTRFPNRIWRVRASMLIMRIETNRTREQRSFSSTNDHLSNLRVDELRATRENI